MKLLSKALVAITVLLSFTACNAQIKNSVTETVKVYGNCEMCKAKIEKAGSLKKIAKVDWNEETKMATLTYDAKKTNQDEILKRIALVGYNSDKFLAPNEVYSKLPGCCKYDREAKIADNTKAKEEMPKTAMTNQSSKNESQLKPIFDNYFLLKDALVQTDAKSASQSAATLLSAINTVKMETLKTEEHLVWMKVLKNLTADTKSIADTQEIEKQRNVFNSLSKSVYELIKISKQETPTYLQHCPMANDGKGADWLSKEDIVKNPYYGSMMLSCGKVTETIK